MHAEIANARRTDHDYAPHRTGTVPEAILDE